MQRTERGEYILDYEDVTDDKLVSFAMKLEMAETYRNKNRSYLGDFITMDIETTTVGRSTDEPIAFAYSIAVYITGECIVCRTWRQYNKLLKRLASYLNLSPYKRLVCYVHNLPYEFQFMRNFMHIEEVFATKKRKVVKCLSKGIEYRCSYKLTNMSLSRFTDSIPGLKHHKLDGEEFDYSILRTPTTPLTPSELDYIYNDVAGLYEALDYTITHDEYNIATIPLTSTGYIRNDLRRQMQANPDNRRNFLATRLNQKEYGLLRLARRGGNTHCNPIWSCMELEDMTSRDMSSAYPAVMIQKPFPMTKFIPISPRRLTDFEEYTKNYATLLDISFNNIKVKTMATIPYIPKAKCTQLLNIVGDNGRVLEAERISMVITDIDYKIIKDTYEWESVECRECYVSEYGYLPMELRKSLLKQYSDKTTLKDGDPYFYMKIKNKFNANFGCMLTDICQDSVEYNENSMTPFTLVKTDSYQAQLDKYYSSRNSFLSYQHGVWVTAWCRYRLQQAIQGLGRDMVYCDTDSAKFFNTSVNRQLFDRLNNEIKQDIKDCGLNCTVHYKGKEYTLGLWAEDGDYEVFKSMGAKKYCYIQDGHFSITVAGLSKSKAKDWLEEHGGIDAFKPGTLVPIGASGRTSAKYNDYDQVRNLTINGEKIEVGSNLVITDVTYQFSLTEDYETLITNIENGVFF